MVTPGNEKAGGELERAKKRSAAWESLGWKGGPAGPHRSSVEAVGVGSWTVSRVWSTGGTLHAVPLAPGFTRVLIGVDGEGEAISEAGPTFRLLPHQLVMLDGRAEVSTKSAGLWVRYEWHLHAPALRQEQFKRHFMQPAALSEGGQALITTLTNTISTRADLADLSGAEHLLEALTGTVMAAIGDARTPPEELTGLQAEHLHAADEVIGARYTQPSFTVSALASEIAVSTVYLHQIYARAGKTPGKAIEERRARAAHMMMKASPFLTRETWEEVAAASGFTSVRRLRAALHRQGLDRV